MTQTTPPGAILSLTDAEIMRLMANVASLHDAAYCVGDPIDDLPETAVAPRLSLGSTLGFQGVDLGLLGGAVGNLD